VFLRLLSGLLSVARLMLNEGNARRKKCSFCFPCVWTKPTYKYMWHPSVVRRTSLGINIRQETVVLNPEIQAAVEAPEPGVGRFTSMHALRRLDNFYNISRSISSLASSRSSRLMVMTVLAPEMANLDEVIQTKTPAYIQKQHA